MQLPVRIDHGRYRKFGKKINSLYHCGDDFGCPVGTTTYAIANGVVAWLGQANGFGGWKPSKKGGVIIVKHGKILGLYGHVDYDKSLRTGQEVKEGDILGTVHGYSFDGEECPHLHFALYKGKDIFSTKWGYVSKKQLEDFINPKTYFIWEQNRIKYQRSL